MHLPNLVQMVGFGVVVGVFSWGGGWGWYAIEASVSMSLRFGNLLDPTIALFLNSSPQSGLLLIIFQLL